MNPVAISLDFYETLVHHRTGRGRGATLMEYLARHGLESDPWEHQVLYDVFDGQASDARWDWVALAERAFRRLRVAAPEGAAAAHAEGIREVLGPASLTVFPEVPEVLARLHAAGYPLAVVSNWQCGLGHFCSALGLEVDHVLASAEVGSAKPDRGIFGLACRRLGVLPRQVLHVGDGLVDDYQGGRDAGLEAVLLCRDDADPGDASPVITDLSGLLDLVDA